MRLPVALVMEEQLPPFFVAMDLDLCVYRCPLALPWWITRWKIGVSSPLVSPAALIQRAEVKREGEVVRGIIPFSVRYHFHHSETFGPLPPQEIFGWVAYRPEMAETWNQVMERWWIVQWAARR